MDAEARKEFDEVKARLDRLEAHLTEGVNVNGLENWSHTGDGSIETFLSGIPGYVPVANRSKPAASKSTPARKS
jgi:hypothetical protein